MPSPAGTGEPGPGDIGNLLEGLGAKRGLSLMFARMKKVSSASACCNA